LLVVAHKYISYYQTDDDIKLPSYKINDEKVDINYNELYYKEGTSPSSFVTVHNFILDDINQSKHLTYVGSANNIYVSLNKIIVSQNLYNNSIFNRDDDNYSYLTQIPFSDKEFGDINTVKIKGYALNQYSMDVYENTLRIATTCGNTWDDSSSNNLYILDENLNILSKLENLAKGESIKSTRFVNDRIYIVTFKTVDPLFVIDASDPNDAKVLGELKIPGYSTYLHPYDENHIIGFGFDTTTRNNNGAEVTKITGLKLSLFDITDPKKPKEMDEEVISFQDNGYSYSELIYNPKALLFDKMKNGEFEEGSRVLRAKIDIYLQV